MKTISKYLICAALVFGSTSAIAQTEGGGNPINFTANELEDYIDENRTELSGDAEIVSGDLTIRAKTIDIFYTELSDESEERSLSSLKAKGNVWVKNGNTTVSSDKMDYDHSTRLAIFEGNVSGKQGDSIIKGSKMEMNLDTNVYRVLGRVSGQIGGSL